MKYINLYYSRILSIPLVGTLIYNLQILLVSKNLLRSTFISNKANQHRDRLLEQFKKESIIIYCKSRRFGRLLSTIKATIILDVTIPDLKKLSISSLYNLMWTLIYCQTVTRKTELSLTNFLPFDFPVAETIIIPCHEHLDVICDYVIQTARSLVNKGHNVYIIPMLKPIWIGRYLSDFLKEEDKKEFLNVPKGVKIFRPLRLIPAILDHPAVQNFNKQFMNLTIKLFIRRLSRPILWCFDNKDWELVQFSGKYAYTIYDCVDFWSSKVKKKAQIIGKNEKLLIKNVNLCVVNSSVLKKLKEKIRRDIHLVPLGFDYDSFITPINRDHETNKIARLSDNIKRPKIGFVGTLSSRIDFTLLRKLIVLMPNVNFIFTEVPKVTDDDYDIVQRKKKQLKKSRNVFFIPRLESRKYIRLLLADFDICIIPYDVSARLNRFCYPMKLMEYFYAGKPVISTPIEELRQYPEFVHIGKNALEWKPLVLDLLSKSWPKKYKLIQRKIAEDNSWDKKVSKILEMRGTYKIT